MEKLEKYLKWSFIVGIIMFSAGTISGIINQVTWFSPTVDAVSIYLITAAIIPLLAFQFIYSANYDIYGIRNIVTFKVLFYLLVFPTVDVCFISGLNTLYQIVPSFEGISDSAEFELARISAAEHLIYWWTATYFGIFIAGKILYNLKERHYWKYYLDMRE